MKRNDGKIWWVKQGRGNLSFAGKRIEPGEKFLAHPDQISEYFRDVVKPLNAQDLVEEEPEIQEPEYVMEHKGYGWYVILNKQSGKQINESNLRKQEAENMLAELKAGGQE